MNCVFECSRFLFLAACLTISDAAKFVEPTGNCSYSFLNQCGKHFMVYAVVDGVFRVPVTAEELSEHCQRQEAAEVCVRQRADRCTTGVVKGIVRFMMDAVRDEREIRCDPSTPEHGAYLRMATCLNSLSKHTLACMKTFGRYTDTFADASVGKTLKEKTPHGCCAFNEYVSCVVDETRRVCGSDAASFNEQLTSGAVGELITSTCEPYKKRSKVCKAFFEQVPPAAGESDDGFIFLGTVAKLADALSARRS
ncbi:uncharacterized protein LOC108863706 [Galendromus occidentalis]|uniref:Uncharacterized protein LOC108863706 n=1 Tax=Galendromus occidentalis TaxID=34638 RepID=A0AAJ7P905_9ACAR|nr:uncharacterized protein LOC108863706 [Galendromus occidentalis]